MSLNFLFMPLLGFFLGVVFIALLKNISLKYNILSIKGIPHIGGIGMGISFLIICLAIFFIYKSSQQMILGILIPAFIILVFGVIDDKKELSVWQKLLVQIIAVSLLISFGIRTKIVHIGYLANIIITFTWVVGITNAFNHLDIMDGLAAGTAAIVSFAFFIVAILNKNIIIALLALSLIGIILSFLIRNFPVARVYMGNSGSHFLGFVLSAIAIAISYAPRGQKIALLSPILILGLPIFDTAFVILMRIKKGKSALMKSNDHLAMRFLKSGYSKNKTLFYMLFLAIFFTLSGVLLSQFPAFIGYVIICFVLLISFILTTKMSRVAIDG